MKIERRKTRSAEVYTASLNDIMFFLLLFFLIISTLVTPAAIKVALPNSKTSTEVVNKKSIQLAITADHRYFLNDKEILFEEIEPALLSIMAQKKENEEINVLLQADKTLNLQDLVNVIDLGNAAKVKMVLFTQKDK
ncbi:MAG: Biopolymer transport protein ExbD/TolR [Bacteroidetes bacterium]|jgi:biopolymer transport protein ExbD|nr:Biopolymer transport protein ExbD/TolR [Bacteroidota bacterium]